MNTEVNISDLTSTVRMVDDGTILSPQSMDRIVHLVMQTMEEREMHRGRVRSEQRVTGGVRANLGDEDR